MNELSNISNKNNGYVSLPTQDSSNKAENNQVAAVIHTVLHDQPVSPKRPLSPQFMHSENEIKSANGAKIYVIENYIPVPEASDLTSPVFQEVKGRAFLEGEDPKSMLDQMLLSNFSPLQKNDFETLENRSTAISTLGPDEHQSGWYKKTVKQLGAMTVPSFLTTLPTAIKSLSNPGGAAFGGVFNSASVIAAWYYAKTESKEDNIRQDLVKKYKAIYSQFAGYLMEEYLNGNEDTRKQIQRLFNDGILNRLERKFIKAFYRTDGEDIFHPIRHTVEYLSTFNLETLTGDKEKYKDLPIFCHIILKQKENEQVKKQVIEQQRQIEELNKKVSELLKQKEK